MSEVRHKCFISYHANDRAAVQQFVSNFDDTHNSFIMRGIRDDDDLINSGDADYVMSEIRRRFLQESTVTIVLLGRCTWSRKFIDWELQSSLRRPSQGHPNGLLGIMLDNSATTAILPEQFKLNYDSGYGLFKPYPAGPATLGGWINAAWDARFTSANLIRNPRERFAQNKAC